MNENFNYTQFNVYYGTHGVYQFLYQTIHLDSSGVISFVSLSLCRYERYAWRVYVYEATIFYRKYPSYFLQYPNCLRKIPVNTE